MAKKKKIALFKMSSGETVITEYEEVKTTEISYKWINPASWIVIPIIRNKKFTDYEICIKSWIEGGKTNQFWINPQNIVAISEPDSVSIKMYNSYIRDLNSHLKNKDNNLLSENDIDEMIKDADDYLNDGDQNDDLDDEDSLGDDPRYPWEFFSKTSL